MIKCAECGYENMDGLDYCDGCGAKLNAGAGSSSAAGPAPETKTEAPAANGGAAAEAAQTGQAGTEAPAEHPQEQHEEGKQSEAPTGEIKTDGAAAPTAEPTGAAAGAPFKAKLSIVRGGRKGQEFQLEDGNNLVGRWDPETGSFPEVDLDADDPEAKISRKHALIRLDAGKITIEDIGSLNGTYVNRQPRLSPGNPVEIKSGDEVIIGKTFLKLVIESIS
jgi:hypothetical protein